MLQLINHHEQQTLSTAVKQPIPLIRNHIQDLIQRLNAIQRFINERAIQKHNIEEHTSYPQMNEQVDQLKAEFRHLEQQKNALEEDVNALESTSNALEQQRDQLNAENRKLQKSLADITQTYERYQVELREMELNCNKCNSDAELILIENRQCEEKIEKLKNDVQDAKANLLLLQNKKQEQTRQLEGKMADLDTKTTDLQAQIDELEIAKAKHERDIVYYKGKIANLQESLQQNNEHWYQTQIDRLELEIENLENNITRTTGEYKDLSADYEQNQQQKMELTTEINKVQQHKQQLESDIKSFEERIQHSELTLINHQKTLQNNEAKHRETIEKLTAQEEQFKNQLAQATLDNHEKLTAKKVELSQLRTNHRADMEAVENAFSEQSTALNNDINKLDTILKTLSEEKRDLRTSQRQLILNISRLEQELRLKEERQAEKQKNSHTDEKQQLLMKLYEQERELFQEEERIKSRKAESLCRMYELQQLTEEGLQQEQYRRKLHNILQDLRGSIRVLSRIRPFMAHDGETEGKTLKFTKSNGEISLMLKDQELKYHFDTILGPESKQSDVFEEVNGIVQSAIDGYNVCLFGYGQTGSGKSWTLTGDLKDQEKKGIIPRSVDLIFAQIKELEASAQNLNMPSEFQLGVSCCQIYQEKIFDLLVEKMGSGKKDEELKVHNDQHNKKVTVIGLGVKPVQSAEQVYNLLELAGKNRTVAQTSMNANSSRSHFVFTLHIDVKLPVTVNAKQPDGTMGTRTVMQQRSGTLNLCDLAGSERVSSAKTSGEQLNETKMINLSLSTLNRVFLQLAEKSSHISFRDSKLTELLQYCLSGDGKTMMIVNVSPTAASAQETSGSLNLARTVSLIQKGKTKQNVQTMNDDGTTSNAPAPRQGGGAGGQSRPPAGVSTKGTGTVRVRQSALDDPSTTVKRQKL